MRCSTVRFGSLWGVAVWYDAVPSGAVQYSTYVRRCWSMNVCIVLMNGMEWHDMVWNGVEWCGMVSYTVGSSI